MIEAADEAAEEQIAKLEAEVKRWRRIAKVRRRRLERLRERTSLLVRGAEWLCARLALDGQFNDLDEETIEAYGDLESALRRFTT